MDEPMHEDATEAFDRLLVNDVSTEHMTEVVKAVRTLMEHFGIPCTLDNNLQLITMLEALTVYSSRTAAYGQAWQQYGAMANLLSVARKTDRLMSLWFTDGDAVLYDEPVVHKDAMDDALDLLNYTVFFMRCVRARNFTGAPPQRPTIGAHEEESE